MHIHFAINGEGRGHLARATALAEILSKWHRISFSCPAHFSLELRTRFPESKVREIPWFRFVQNGFDIDYGRTIGVNARLFLEAKKHHRSIASCLIRERVDAVVSDFEPFTSRASKIAGLPVLQLNHPAVVLRSLSPSPAGIASALVARYMSACADRTVICSFFDGDVGPIVRRELREQKTVNGDYFVVYQKDLYRDVLTPVLRKIGLSNFKIFPDPEADYAAALAGCAGLVAPAGHQSISEALALGKPSLVIPVGGQYEQELNARKLVESGFGESCHVADLGVRLSGFMERAGVYAQRIADAQAVSEGSWKCRDETSRAAALVEAFAVESLQRIEWRTPKPVFSWYPRPEWSA